MNKRENEYGNHADPIFFGGGKDETYDEKREKPAYYAAGADSGNPQTGEGSGCASVCGKRQEYCADGIWKIFAEEISALNGADGRNPGAA